MKINDEQYGQWLEKLRDTMPVLSDPDKLTLDILRAVDHLPQKVRKRNVKSWKIMSWMSVTAAGFFVVPATERDGVFLRIGRDGAASNH